MRFLTAGPCPGEAETSHDAMQHEVRPVNAMTVFCHN